MKKLSLYMLAMLLLLSLASCGKNSGKGPGSSDIDTEWICDASDIYVQYESEKRESQESQDTEQADSQGNEPIEPTEEPEIINDVSMLMVGDNLIHQAVYNYGLKYNGEDFDYIYEHVKSDVEAADIAIINQETIFVEDPARYSHYPSFGTPMGIGDSAVKAGFDVIAHATNHTFDKGESAILETINFWETKHPEITYLGIHDTPDESDIAYVSKNGIDFAFVNYTYDINGPRKNMKGKTYLIDFLTDDDIEDTLKEARANSDVLVAILHMGIEYTYTPDEKSRAQVERFIDNGVDIVLCAHPHVVQPYGIVETEKGNTGLVYYSLGNFISAQDRLERMIGGMAMINIRKITKGDESEISVSDYDMVPLVTHEKFPFYTTYKLEDYPDNLLKGHDRQKDKYFVHETLVDFYNGVIEKGVN